MASPDPTNHTDLPPLQEFQLTIAARPMQDGTVDIHIGTRQMSAPNGVAALGLIVGALTDLVTG